MAVVENRFVCDLSKPVQAQALKGNVFSLDNLGSRLSVLIYNNGQPATISGSITANCILPDGSTVDVNGNLTTENGGSKAYVDVPQSCLLIPGILKIAIKCKSSSVITTLAAIVANVYMTETDNVITPSQQIINDWNDEISAAIATQNAAIANQDTKINDLKSAINIDHDGGFTFEFASGKRLGTNPSVIAEDEARVTTTKLANARIGDVISVKGTYTGIKFNIVGAGTSVVSSGWVNHDLDYVVDLEGVYYINVAKSNETSTISPSDITFTAKYVTREEYKTSEIDNLEDRYFDQYETISNNLFDKSRAIIGYYIRTNGVIDKGGDWCISTKIPVEASSAYYQSYVCEEYSSDGTPLAYHGANDPGSFTTNANTAYIIFSCQISAINSAYVNKGSNKGYDNYKAAFKEELVQVDDTLLEAGVPADAKTTGEKLSVLDEFDSEIVLSNNLLDKNALTYGKYVISSNGSIGDLSSSNWISEKIPVIAGYVYYIWGNAGIYKADGTFLHFHSVNDSGLYEIPSGGSYIICSGNTSNLSSWYVNKFKNTENDTYKSITMLDAKLNGVTVAKDGSGDYSSLTKALWDNIGLGLTFYVKPGEYDIISEYQSYFGSDVFDASKFDANNDPIAHSAWYEGLPIKNSFIYMDSNAIVKFNYTGSVQGVINWFSPFKYTAPGGELHGGQIYCSNCRYAIHDDCYASSYDRRITDGVYIYYRSSRNVAIGGGLGKSSYVEFKNCYVDSTSSGYGVWYHNATLADAQSMVVIHDNYVSSYIEIQPSGPSELVSKALVSNNKCRAVERITSSMTVDNFQLIEWNNVTG